ncbi:MAG: hypothetical protein RSE12_06685 [Fuscovulum sp.]|nr:MAG: hypothetical protein RSE12_06685 [Fuscovulum sp.]
MTRYSFLLLLAILSVATPVFAKDGSDDGGGNSGSDSGGDSGGDDNGGDSNGDDSADDDDNDDDDSDRARAGVSSGAILPLAAILGGVENRFGARMINAELHRKSGRLIYELELITPAGRVLGVSVDAATARVIRIND